MKFKQYKNGSCDIEFSWRERFLLFKNGKLHLSDEYLKHFGNNLVKIVVDWNEQFNEELKQKITLKNTEIKSK